MAVELLMNLRNSTQHQQLATQLITDIQKGNNQNHQKQGVLQSKSQDSVCKNLQRKSEFKPNKDEGEASNEEIQN